MKPTAKCHASDESSAEDADPAELQVKVILLVSS